MKLQKKYFQNILTLFQNKLYLILWYIFSPFSGNVPTFILIKGMYYTMIENILPYLPKYRIYAAIPEVAKYLDNKGIKYTKHIFFPKYIVDSHFIIRKEVFKILSNSLQVLLQIKKLKKIQTYHGILDKGWTYDRYNKQYDLLLVPGKYGKNRLRKIGIEREKIKVVGYPKFDSYYSTTKRIHKKHHKPILLYAPTWGVISTMPYMLEKLIELNKIYKVIVKPHFNTDWYYLRWLETNGIEVFHGDNIVDLFYKVDLLISDSSSAMFEFMITNKPIIVIDIRLWLKGKLYTNALNGPEIIYRDIFYRVNSINGLNTTIKKLLTKKTNKNKSYQFICNHIFEPIHPAGKRSAEEIMSFIHSNT